MRISPFDISLRLIIWFLLTADLSLPNVAIGLGIALILPSTTRVTAPIKVWITTIFQMLIMIPQAYWEAITMMVFPHNQVEIEYAPIPKKRTLGFIFLDIFRITFTPKTIVLKHDPVQGYQVHRIARRKEQ